MTARNARGSRAVHALAALLALSVVVTAPCVRADAGWFESGDTQLRNDLQLLNDAEVIRVPLTQWPIPRAMIAYAVGNARRHFATNNAVSLALARVEARLDATALRGMRLTAEAVGGEPALLRDFDTFGRDNGFLGAGAALPFGERAEISLHVSAVADPSDDRPVRFDGSHATLALGNWLVSAQTLERWWGPAHESSLILSNNARPMPSVVIERATARPFESPWLSWLGPWRFSFGIGQMEDHRQDIDAPLFMAWRVTIMPFKDVELGFSRTAQFCGKQLICDTDSFFNMLVGNDNVGFDTTAATEPGNQMAGFDIRWASPIGDLPYAFYAQMIGEDESSYLPAKYLAQFGLEGWKPLADGGLVLLYAEWANTSCSAVSKKGPYDNCAYNQGRFDIEGYRYYGRVIGHTTDRDSRSFALGAAFTERGGDVWTATARMAELNRDGTPDPTDALTTIPLDYAALELGWRGRLWNAHLSADVGVESREPQGAKRDVGAYGFVGLRYEFK